MAFVIEEIPEEYKNKFDLSRTWVIDHERNAFLVPMGGDRDFDVYELHWKGGIARIGTEKWSRHLRFTGEMRNGKPVANVNFSFVFIHPSDDLVPFIEKIKLLTVDAFNAYGNNMDPDRTGEINIINLEKIRVS